MSEPANETGSSDVGSAGWALYERLLLHIHDLGSIALAVLGLVTVLGLGGWTHGRLINPWSAFLWRWFGLGSLAIPVVFLVVAIFLYRRGQGESLQFSWGRLIALEIAAVCLLSLLSLLDGLDLPRAEAGYGGGLVGWGIGRMIAAVLGEFWSAALAIICGLLFGAYAGAGMAVAIADWFERWAQKSPAVPAEGEIEEQPVAVMVRPQKQSPIRPKPSQRLPRKYRKHFQVESLPEEPSGRVERRDERLPPIDLLDEGKMRPVSSKEVNLTAGLIEKTLADFGLPARVVNFRTGPAVTQYAVEPGFLEQRTQNGEIRRQKVRVSQITALASDLALALSAPSLRVEAPVPGEHYVGIEVPNQKPSLVRLRPVIESKGFQSIESPLGIGLGRDVAGKAVAADLAMMPHLLIAGTTGSGKSVCITSIATCLAMNNTPDDLRLVMIDPKKVELLRFNGLTHLFGKVESELDRIAGVLRWCTREMDRRYRLLEEAGARDLDMYRRRTRRKRNAEHLPRIVVIIDELSDLMMIAPDQTERTLVRLAQMARATGIHLVVATQRPSTDVVTGLIKANFPARISFAVASGVDSRVILDTPGAETLLGRGDMLFLSAEAGVPQRMQGVFVSDREIERLIGYWHEVESEQPETEEGPWEDLLIRQEMLEDRDEILEEAIELVKERGEASASLLQRTLRVGYPRAARLMDEMEELGVVGRQRSGGRTREVLIGENEDPLTLQEDEGQDSA